MIFVFFLPSLAYGLEWGLINIKSWEAIKYAGVIRQKRDDSCGASALATLLNMHGESVTEAEILQETAHEGRLSFEDIRYSASQRGYQAAGFAGNMDILKRLKYPVIVFLRLGKGLEHFSVLYGMGENTVYLADPALGRQVVEGVRFERLWRTRDSPLQGRFLVVFPKKESHFQPWENPSPLYGNRVVIRHLIPFKPIRYAQIVP